MRLFQSLRRPQGGFMVDPGEQRAEAARAVIDGFSQHIDRKLNIEFGRIIRKMETIMRRLEDVLDVVSQQKTKIDSLNALMDAQRAEIQRILANSGTSQTTQQLIDQVFDRLQENTTAIDAAIAENIDSGKEDEQKKDAGVDGKSAEEIFKANEEKKAEEIGKATTNPPPEAQQPVWGEQSGGQGGTKPAEDGGKSDTSGAPTGPANSADENAKGNVDQTPPFGADKTEGSTDARDGRPDIADPAVGDPGGNTNAGMYNQTAGQMDTAGRPPVINPATGQPAPGIVGGAPPSDTGNKDLSMPADVGSMGMPGDPATSPAMQQGLSGTGGASNTSDPNSGHQANVAVSDAPEPPVAKDNAIGDQPLKDSSRPVGPVDQNGQPFDEVEAKRKAEQGAL